MSEHLKTVISGSFKFKPEIDQTRREFEELGVVVLEPTAGWLVMPSLDVTLMLRHGQIRPLPSEEALNTRQIEERFLRGIAQSDFMYICNPEGYVGLSMALELGYAIGSHTPVFAREPFAYDKAEIYDLAERKLYDEIITVASPEDVVSQFAGY